VYARSTTILAHPENLDRGIALVRDEVMPAVLDAAGCIGMSMIVDRESGRCITTTAWESMDAMRDSEGLVRPMRDRVADVLGARAQVDEWELGVLHRAHNSSPGACVRVTWMRFDPAMDHGLDVYRQELLPAMERMDGFCSASLLMDRPDGIRVSSVTFDSADAMAASRDEAERMRTNVTAELGAEVLEVAEFELALAHLRVPELI
jgi:heme-degrading monooxygenase HmoA